MTKISTIAKNILKHDRQSSEIRSMGKLDEDDLSLNRQDAETMLNTRPGVREQLVSMAAKFGVSASDIDKERWRALEIVHACTHCEHSKSCFQYLAGKQTSGFDPKSCPNLERYEDLSAKT